MTFRFLFILMLTAGIIVAAGCASTDRRDLETQLIDAFIREGKSLEVKIEREGEIGVIDPTQRFSERGCPIARIRK